MASVCLQLMGFLLSTVGWICVIIATSTSDWVIRCKYGMNTCRKMDELETKGLWEQCVISTALYHCFSLNQILELPALLLSSMPCFHLGDDSVNDKNKRSAIGGILVLVVAMFSLASTIWFPVGAHQELGLMSFGFSLYSGWVGGALSLLGGCILTCCSINSTPSYQENNHHSYYSKQNTPTNQTPPTGNHAKTAHV
ncbi:claudin-11a isoform X3 [Neoarius graeffei]|uniref:claudin-11a isoform X3 n=1 Tax=Neoarius graeffei TaxID=443677 RepID=UPI00298D5675|nr:claudin-11a isoform X3 [Neoarius graeffei]